MTKPPLNLLTMPLEIRAKIYKILDMESLLKFGESNTRFIPEILRCFPKTQWKEFWFASAKEGCVKWLSILEKLGLPINAHDAFGRTALHIAVSKDNIKEVRVLINLGVDVGIKDKRCDATALHWAVCQSNLDIFKLLIKAGSDVNSQDDLGGTPLHVVAQIGFLNRLKELIKAGADVNARNHNGDTPLHLATDEKAFVSALIKAGADVNVRNRFGRTVLDLSKDETIRKILEDAGAK
jgi:ankyrin repeat protein